MTTFVQVVQGNNLVTPSIIGKPFSPFQRFHPKGMEEEKPSHKEQATTIDWPKVLQLLQEGDLK